MNTQQIMDIALKLAGLEEIPADSIIAVEGNDIKKIMIGVDMETSELLLAKQKEVDLVISHHPKSGTAKINFHNVMERQIDRMVEFGVPINKAQKALKRKMNSVEIFNHVKNFDRIESFAKVLEMPFMNIHIPADIIGETFVQQHLNVELGGKPKATLKDILESLNKLPEYSNSICKPVIRVGSSNDYCGKIAVLMAGGTNGGAEVFKAYFEAGVGTIVCMHAPEDVIKEAEKQNIGNIIVAGHMPSDSIGLNIIIKKLESLGLEIIKMSGIISA